MNLEIRVPGCGYCNSFTRVCGVMSVSDEIQPSLAQKTLIEPPGAIEGPPSSGVRALVCTASSRPEVQKGCSHFVVRTTSDDLRDENI